MKIRNLILAEAANATGDGKQNVLGAGVRIVNSPAVPFGRPLVLIIGAEGEPTEREDVPVKVSIRAPNRSHVLLNTVAQFHSDTPVDDRLPLTLNVAVDLTSYAFEEFGTYELIALVGKTRRAYTFAVDEQVPGE